MLKMHTLGERASAFILGFVHHLFLPLSLEVRGWNFAHRLEYFYEFYDKFLPRLCTAPLRKTLISQSLSKNSKIWFIIFLTLNWKVYMQNFSPLAFKLREEFEVTDKHTWMEKLEPDWKIQDLNPSLNQYYLDLMRAIFSLTLFRLKIKSE